MPLSLDAPDASSTERYSLSDGAMVLPRKLDSRSAPILMQSLLSARGQPIKLDLSQVELLGLQCAMVLVSAAKTWSNDSQGLTPTNPSEHFEHDLQLLGLQIEDVSAP